jgi:hypothetical protein
MGFFDDVADFFENLGNDIAKEATDFGNRVAEDATTFGNDIKDAFDQTVRDTENLGNDLGTAITNMTNDVVESTKLPDSVVNGINEFFGGPDQPQYEVPGPVVDESKASSDPYVPPVQRPTGSGHGPVIPDPNPPVPDPNPPVPDPNPPVPDPNPPVPDPNPPVPDPNPPIPDPNPPIPDPNPPIPDPNPNPRNLIQNGGDSHIEDLVPTDGGTRSGMRLGNRNLQSMPQNDLIISGNVDWEKLQREKEVDPNIALNNFDNSIIEEIFVRTFGKEKMTGEYFRSSDPPVIVGESFFKPVDNLQKKIYGETILNPLIGAGNFRGRNLQSISESVPLRNTSSYSDMINNAKSQIMSENYSPSFQETFRPSINTSYSEWINNAKSQIMAEN